MRQLYYTDHNGGVIVWGRMLGSAPSSSTLIQTINGLAYALVKTWNGVATANVQTIEGLA